MAVSVTFPRMGESVTEGTIVRWLKQEGERVEEDEPLVEISTDKIDTELPSPASGVLAKILVGPDQTVDVDTEIAIIEEAAGGDGKAARPEPAREERAAPERQDEAAVEAPAAREGAPTVPQKESREPAAPAPRRPAARVEAPTASGRPKAGVLSPLVRRLAREHGVDLSQIEGSGAGGRVTKDDVLAFVERRRAAPAAAERPAARAEPARVVAAPAGETEDVAFTHIRRAIAEHMSRSRKTAAHVTNVVEVDMTRVARLRERAKDAFRRAEGIGLTYLPFIASAVIEALRAFPEFNAHILEDGRTARLYRRVNLGIAVGRDEGLIVPVVHGADGMNLVGLARAINDVGTRARAKGGLKPEDVQGGTFTITNNGVFGAIIDTPIIAQPQVAILGTNAVVKRPAVITVDGADAIAIRHLMFLSLSYDHRWIDGHRAAQFNNRIKALLEDADYSHELGLEPEGGA